MECRKPGSRSISAIGPGRMGMTETDIAELEAAAPAVATSGARAGNPAMMKMARR